MTAGEMTDDTVTDSKLGLSKAESSETACPAEALIRALNRSLATKLPVKSPPSQLPAKITAQSGSIYEILHVLGRGGMGTVFLAKRQQDAQLVALKVSRCEEDLDAQTVIRNEGKLLAGISHRFIVKLIEAGETVTGYPFVAMEYAAGESLQHLLRKSGSLSFEKTREICLQIANAIAALHRQGIFHRDLKPSNIIISTTDAGLKVTLIDFGIAEAITENFTTKGYRTSGSLFYLSPEQLHDNPFSCQSEIYQLALIMFECLTGRLPFSSSVADAILYRLKGNVFPTDNSAAYLFPAVRVFLNKALSRNQGNRHASMTEFEQELKALKQELTLAA